MATETQQRSGKGDGFPLGKITVEVKLPNNRNWFSVSIKRKLRGAWQMGNMVGATPASSFAQMPDTPGMRLTLDCGEKRLEIVDPLSEDEELLRRVNVAHLGHFRTEVRPHDTVVQEDLTDDRMKTILGEWAFMFHREGKLVVLAGVLPTVAEVRAMPGRTEINQMDSNPAAPRVEATS